MKKTCETCDEAQLRHERIIRDAAEQKLRKENEAEEKVVEDMLLEDYIEGMEVQDVVLDEEAIVEITHDEFHYRP